MDISTYNFDNPANVDLSNIEGGFGALLAGADTNTVSKITRFVLYMVEDSTKLSYKSPLNVN